MDRRQCEVGLWINLNAVSLNTLGNSRHDLDSAHPRSLTEIYDLNRALSKRFKHIFEDNGVPVVPSLGNNDIYRTSRES